MVTASVVGHDPGSEEVIRLGGGGGTLRLAIVIRNDGDRDAGRGTVEVKMPPAMADPLTRWTDAGGHPMLEFAERAGRLGNHAVITRPLWSVARDVPEMAWLNLSVSVPYQDNVNEYPIQIRAAAEGADAEALLDFPLRIGRDPSQ